MQRYYIADPHFGHQAVIKMTQRPFETVQEMDQCLIDNWNTRVRDEDEVYIIGDFMYRSRYTADHYLSRLNGKKHLILGNHDKWTETVDLSKYLESVSHIKEITDDALRIVLCHYPMAEWPGFYRGSLHIFGHIHNRQDGDAFLYYKNNPRMLNAGVEINHFTPVGLQELIGNNSMFREKSQHSGPESSL